MESYSKAIIKHKIIKCLRDVKTLCDVVSILKESTEVEYQDLFEHISQINALFNIILYMFSICKENNIYIIHEVVRYYKLKELVGAITIELELNNLCF